MLRGLAGIVLVGIFLIAAVSGCGGGDDDSLTQAEYRKQANAICSEGNDQKNKAVGEAYKDPKKAGITGDGKTAQLELLNNVALPPIISMTEELASLGGPSGEEEKAEALVEALEAEIDELETNPETVIDASANGGEFAKANKLATELDLKACSEI